MSEFYIFAGQHPLLTFFIGCLAYSAIVAPLKLANRFLRSRNIKNAGWPPAHLDADGDLVKK